MKGLSGFGGLNGLDGMPIQMLNGIGTGYSGLYGDIEKIVTGFDFEMAGLGAIDEEEAGKAFSRR